MLIIPFVVVVIGFIITWQNNIKNYQVMIITDVFISLFLCLEMFIVSKVIMKRLSESKLVFRPDGFERISGKSSEVVNYDLIKLISVRCRKNRILKEITIYAANKTICISGYEDMAAILDLFGNKTTDKIYIREIQLKLFNLKDPETRVFLLGLFLILFLFIIFQLQNLIILAVTVAILLIYKPITKKFGIHFRKLEIFISVMCLICIVLFILMDFLFQISLLKH